MKILHICLCGLWCEKFAYHENLLPKYHRLMGNEVTIIAPTYEGYLGAKGEMVSSLPGTYQLENGIKLIRVKPLIKNYEINKHLHIFHNIKRIVLNEHPDFIYVHNVYSLNYLSLVAVKKIMPKLKIVFDNHADSLNSARTLLTKFINGFIYKYFLTPRLNSISNIFYGVTPSRCTFLNTMYGIPKEKIRLLSMGADDECMREDNRIQIRADIRKTYNIGNDDFLIVTGGKIDIKRNIHLLAQAVNELNNPHIKLLMFGSIHSELKDFINRSLCDRVFFIGWIDSKKVYDYFYAADLVAFPGLHSVMWEQAVSCRVPCCFAKIDGFDHVNINNNCLFFEHNDVNYYKELITSLFDDKLGYMRLLHNSMTADVEDFKYSGIAKKVLRQSFENNE